MNKILIVADTTCSLTIEQAKDYGIVLLPLSVVIDNKEYLDLYEINNDSLVEHLKNGAIPKTSQPSVGLVEKYFEGFIKDGYDDIIVFTINSDLSGTYQNICIAAQNLGMENVHVVDTRSAAFAIGHCAILASKLAKENKNAKEILASCDEVLKRVTTYIYPLTLDQLKKGGRISKGAATMSALLKLKPVLVLDYQDKAVEKLGIARTQAKAFEMIIQELVKKNVNEEEYYLSIPYVEDTTNVELFIQAVKKAIPNIECRLTSLPAVLTSHVGLGAFGVQPIYRIG